MKLCIRDNGSGDAGRLQVANLAGTVTQGGKVGVLEQLADDRSGRQKFMASYVYTALMPSNITQGMK